MFRLLRRSQICKINHLKQNQRLWNINALCNQWTNCKIIWSLSTSQLFRVNNYSGNDKRALNFCKSIEHTQFELMNSGKCNADPTMYPTYWQIWIENIWGFTKLFTFFGLFLVENKYCRWEKNNVFYHFELCAVPIEIWTFSTHIHSQV